MTRRTALLAVLVFILCATTAVAAQQLIGGIGPSERTTVFGHHLTPAGRMSTVGDFATGAALTPDGRFLWVVDAGHGRDDARIVSIRTGRTVQILPLPGADVGVTVSADGTRAYVSGEPNGDSKPVGPVQGTAGDVIHVFSIDRRSGRAVEQAPITLPKLSGGTAQQHASAPFGLPAPPGPTAGSALDWPEGLSVSRDGTTLAVALDQADQLALIDTRTRAIRTVKVGAYPYDTTISPDGRTAYVSNQLPGTVSVVDIPSATVTATIGVGGAPGDSESHPEGLTLDRSGRHLYVAVASRDLVAVIDTRRRQVIHSVSVADGPAPGTEPIALAAAPDGRTLYVADAGADSLAVVALPGHRRTVAYSVIGRIPTAAYPSAVAVTPNGRRLIWLAAEGLGAGPNPGYGQFFANSDKAPYGNYVPDMLLGRVGVTTVPVGRRLARLTRVAERQSLPSDLSAAPPGTPVRSDGPIKHVFIIVRENRTYDQIFGTEPRGDGDPALELFDDNGVAGPAGGVTPNAHALVRRFPLLDHFYADSEVSVDGHLITSGGYAIDYVKKALHPNYSDRGRVDEFGSYPISLPPRDFIFDQAVRQNVSFANDGELNAGIQPGADDGRSTYAAVGSHTYLEYPLFFGCDGIGAPVNAADQSVVCDTDSGTLGPAGATGTSNSRFDFFQNQLNSELASGSVPALNYLTLPNDHTNGVRANYPTPKALVADNDLGLGQIVDLISHSSIWSSSAILVMEDDSQDGADHVDAHRMPAFVISPWANAGAVVPERYDQESMLRTAEIILGLEPLSRFDATAEPMYDAFRNDGHPDMTPYTAITPTQPIRQVTSGTQAAAAGPLAAKLPFDRPDMVPQALFDQALYRDVYGLRFTPPAPGPDASPLEAGRAAATVAAFRAGEDVRRFLLHAGPDPVGDDITEQLSRVRAARRFTRR